MDYYDRRAGGRGATDANAFALALRIASGAERPNTRLSGDPE